VDKERSRLLLCGGYARSGELSPDPEIAFGAGLAGQCALDRKSMLIEHPPADYIRIHSALTTISPTHLLLRPIINTEKLLGVVELSLLKPMGAIESTLLDQILPVVAMCMEILDRYHDVRALPP
jgi:two-component system sensor histidine kinase/response regulator